MRTGDQQLERLLHSPTGLNPASRVRKPAMDQQDSNPHPAELKKGNMHPKWLSHLLHPRKHKNHELYPHGQAVLTEIAAPPPVQNRDEAPLYRHDNLEEVLSNAPTDPPSQSSGIVRDQPGRGSSLDNSFEPFTRKEST